MTIVYAIAVLGVLAIVFGLILAVAAKVFEVEVDPRLPEIQACLAGANCGGCGYPGCGGCAEAILAGKAPVTACAPAGPENAAKIAAIMGMEAPSGDKMVAHVLCNGGCNAKDNFEYRGVKDCLAATKVCGGDAKACRYGCFGFGSCVAACKFDAIHVEQRRCRGGQGEVHQLRRLPRCLPAPPDRGGALQAEGVCQLLQQGQGPRRYQGLRQQLHRLRYV